MKPRLDHDAIVSTLLLEVHRNIEAAADSALDRIARLPAERSPAPHEPSSAAEAALPPGMAEAISSFAHELKQGTTLGYPPNDEGTLTGEELQAIATLDLSPAARSALRKIVRNAANEAFFHFFCLLDAVGDPAMRECEGWGPIDLSQRDDDSDRSMMHDDLGESFWQYARLRDRRRVGD